MNAQKQRKAQSQNVQWEAPESEQALSEEKNVQHLKRKGKNQREGERGFIKYNQ